MPVVTVESRPNGDPIATTAWPTWSESEEPIVAGVRPLTSSAWITAVSVSGSVPTIVALACEPSLKDTCTSPESPATSTTWLLVRICPSELKMMPEPEPWPSAPATSILTTEGSTVWATCSTDPSPDAAAGVSTTGEVERGADADAVVRVVLGGPHRGAAHSGARADQQRGGHDRGGERAGTALALLGCGRRHGALVRHGGQRVGVGGRPTVGRGVELGAGAGAAASRSRDRDWWPDL